MITKKSKLEVQLDELTFCVHSVNKETDQRKAEEEKLDKLRAEVEAKAPVDEDKIRAEANQVGYDKGYEEGYATAKEEASEQA